MPLCKKNLAKYILCSSNLKFPMYNGHYMTGKDISLFSNLVCIENSLNNLTCSIKSLYNNKFRDK